MSRNHLRSVPDDGGRPISCREAQDTFLFGGSPLQEDQARHHDESCDTCNAGLLLSTVPSMPRADLRLRVLLGCAVVAQVVLAGPWVLGLDPWGLTAMDQAHLTRDGAVGLSAAAAGALAAYRPRYAQPSFVLASASLILQAATSLFDRSNDDLMVADEVVHIFSVLLVISVGSVALSIKNSSLRMLTRSTTSGLASVPERDQNRLT